MTECCVYNAFRLMHSEDLQGARRTDKGFLTGTGDPPRLAAVGVHKTRLPSAPKRLPGQGPAWLACPCLETNCSFFRRTRRDQNSTVTASNLRSGCVTLAREAAAKTPQKHGRYFQQQLYGMFRLWLGGLSKGTTCTKAQPMPRAASEDTQSPAGRILR